MANKAVAAVAGNPEPRHKFEAWTAAATPEGCNVPLYTVGEHWTGTLIIELNTSARRQGAFDSYISTQMEA